MLASARATPGGAAATFGVLVLPLGALASTALLVDNPLSVTDGTVLVIAAALGLAVTSLLIHHSKGDLLFAGVATSMVGAGGALVALHQFGGDYWTVVAVSIGCMAALVEAAALSLIRRDPLEKREYLSVTAGQLAVVAMVMVTAAAIAWAPGPLVQGMLGFAAIIALTPAHTRMKRLLDRVIAAEGSHQEREVGAAKVAAYTWAGAVLTAFIAVLLLIATRSHFSSLGPASAWASIAAAPYWAALTLIAVHLAFIRPTLPRRRRLWILIIANLLFGVCAAFEILRWLADHMGQMNLWALSAALIACLALGLFVYEGVVANCAYMQLKPVGSEEASAAFSAALVAAAAMAWPAIFVQSRDHGGGTLPAASTLLATGFAVAVFGPWSTSRHLRGADPADGLVPASPLSGVLQDAFLGTVLALSVGWLPTLYIATVLDQDAALANVLIYAGVMFHSYLYIMHNNSEHASRFANATEHRIDAKTHALAARALSRHVRRQNRIALVLPPIFAGFVLTQLNPYHLQEAALLLGGPLLPDAHPPVAPVAPSEPEPVLSPQAASQARELGTHR